MLRHRGRVRNCAAGMLLLSASCSPGWAPDPGPGPTALDWRSLVGCYQRDSGREFAFDSAAVTGTVGLAYGRVGRRASSTGTRARDVLWQVSDRNTVIFIVDDGLHGYLAELGVRADSLVGRVWGSSDVSSGPPRPYRFAAVRVRCAAGVGGES